MRKGFAPLALLLVLAGVLIIASGFYYFNYWPPEYDTNGANPKDIQILSDSDNEIKFVGYVMLGGQDTCPFDGICSLIVGDIEVIWAKGWPQEPVGSMDNQIDIGDKVEIYGKREGNNVVTIYGSEEYYIKKVATQDTKVEVYSYTFFAFGGSDILRIFSDGSFEQSNDLPMNDKTTCIEGTVSSKNYTSILDILKSSDLINKEITQVNEAGLICEGGELLMLNIDGESNGISTPCVGALSSETKDISDLMSEINTKIKEIIDKSPQDYCSTEQN